MTPVDPATIAPPWPGESINSSADEAKPQRAHRPEDLVNLYSAEIWRFASSQISKREDAEDVVMEVFAAAFSDFAKIQRAEDQRLWLLGIARKKMADCLRKRYRRAEQPLSSAEQSFGAIMPNEFQIATRGALSGLPENEREALILKYVNGLSTEEVGIVIRRSLAATNSLLQRARQSLREALGPQVLGKSGEIL